jgi:hypothetical protein
MKMIAFWDTAPCSLEVGQRFGVAIASVIRAMMKYASIKRQSISTRLHGAISDKISSSVMQFTNSIIFENYIESEKLKYFFMKQFKV